jgi:hypothetical protein
MKQKKIIMILGIISMILLVSPRSDAADIYTRPGWIACETLYDLDNAMGIFWSNDNKALAEMVAEGKCIIFSAEVKVNAWHPEWTGRERQIRFPGSSKTYWVDFQALIYREEKSPEGKGSAMSVREWFVLKSFLWIEPHKTTKEEIIKKYGEPTFQDRDSILYRASKSPDFREWKTVKFLIDTSGVVEQIRAEK